MARESSSLLTWVEAVVMEITLITRQQKHLPASLVGKAIAHGAHGVADGNPFRAADDPNILNIKNSEEQVLVGPVVPVFVHVC